MAGGMIHRIRFTKHAGGKYYSGDVAGFSLPECREFVARGAAVWVDEPPNGHDDGGATESGDAPVPAAGLSTHEKSVSEVRGLVAEVTSVEGLRALRDSEVAHPRYEDGRTTALEAIDDRIAALEAEAAEADADADGD